MDVEVGCHVLYNRDFVTPRCKPVSIDGRGSMKHHPSQEAVSGVPMRNYSGSGQFIVYRNCLNLLSPEEIMPPWDGAHCHARWSCPPGLAVIFYIEGSFLERLLCDGEQCRHRLDLIFVELRIRRGIDHRLNQYLSIPTGIYRHPWAVKRQAKISDTRQPSTRSAAWI